MGLLHCRQILYLLNDKGILPTLGLSISEVSAQTRGTENAEEEQTEEGGEEKGAQIPFWFPQTAAAAAAKSLQSCPTLCDPIDGSPPGSPIPGILQARTLEWVAISFSNA